MATLPFREKIIAWVIAVGSLQGMRMAVGGTPFDQQGWNLGAPPRIEDFPATFWLTLAISAFALLLASGLVLHHAVRWKRAALVGSALGAIVL